MGKRLTTKQRRFCEGIASGLSQKDAAICAGYSRQSADQQASALMNHPNVARRLEELHRPSGEMARVDAEWITRQLILIYCQAMRGVPVLDRDGNPTGARVRNFAGALRALELLGKRLGMFVTSVQETRRDELPELAHLTADQRASLREALEAVVVTRQ